MNRINIAFSFDKNYVEIAKVAIGSLLQASHNKSHYNIYCICSQDVKKREKELTKFLKSFSTETTIHFCYQNNQFGKGYEIRGISTATYYRLLLHKMLPDVDKIIYSDLDVIFQKDLAEVWNFDIKNHAIAGVKASFNLNYKWVAHEQKYQYFSTELKNVKGRYIQAGFLLMNLEEIRKMNIQEETFISMAQKKYFYVDQDIINIIYKDKTTFLPPKCNYFACISNDEYKQMVEEKIYTSKEVEEAKNDFIMCHYAGKKPWDNFKIAKANHWLNFVRSNQELAKIFLFESKWSLLKYKFLAWKNKDKNLYTLAKERHKITKPWLKYYNPSYKFIKNTLINQMINGCGYYPNIDSPKTLNEKIQWLKLYYRNKDLVRCTDKYLMRDFVEKAIGKKYLIPILGAWENVEDIDFDKLPNQFVLKANWGSGQNLICKDKTKLNIYETKQKLREWLLPFKNHYFWGYEWAYKDIKPRIVAEKYIEQVDGKLLDYKIFCSRGIPLFLFIASDRATNIKFDFYDLNLNKLPVSQHYPNSDKTISVPSKWNKLLQLSAKISKEFPFVRTDFYILENRIYIGELTFYHFNGCEAFQPQEWDLEFGKLIKLPKPEGEYKYRCYINRIFSPVCINYLKFKLIKLFKKLEKNNQLVYKAIKKRKKIDISRKNNIIREKIGESANFSANRFNYYRCRLLANLTFGKMRKHYKEKKKKLKAKITEVRNFTKENR